MILQFPPLSFFEFWAAKKFFLVRKFSFKNAKFGSKNLFSKKIKHKINYEHLRSSPSEICS